MKKTKKYMIITVAAVLTVTLITLVILNLTGSNKFLPDSDSGYYTSTYLTYCDGKIYEHYDHNKTNVYDISANEKHTVDTDFLSDDVYKKILIDDMIVYCDEDNVLYSYDINYKTEKIISKSFDEYIQAENFLVYIDDGNIYKYDLHTDEKELVYDNAYRELISLCVQNDYLYYYANKGYDYIVTVFDLSDKAIEAEFKVNDDNSDSSQLSYSALIANKDEVIITYIYDNAYNVITFDFSGSRTTNEYISELFNKYSDIELCCYKGDYLYFTRREHAETVLYDITKRYKDNGLYKLNMKTGETDKLSDICNFTDIIVTDNYLYCYKIKYLIPNNAFKLDLICGSELMQFDIK